MHTSIIIPTYNRLKTLQQVLPSYLAQKYLLEIIIVNDASTDQTSEYIKSLKNPLIKLIENKKNLGQASSKNIGVENADGEFISIGEDDLFFAKTYLETIIPVLQKENADIGAGKLIYLKINETPESTFILNKKTDAFFNKWTLQPNYLFDAPVPVQVPFLHACSVIKKKVFENIQFNSQFQNSALREETDFYLTAYKQNFKILFIPQTTVYHLPIDQIKGGTWKNGILLYQWSAIKNNFIFYKHHQKTLKEIGLKSNIFLFNFIHILNRMRILFRILLFRIKQVMQS